jgi:hypothetical protein
MAKKLYEEENIRAIAVKIRERTLGTKTYTTEQMPKGVDSVFNAGVQLGHSQGYEEGHTDGYWEGYEDGKAEFSGKFMDWNATYSADTITFTATNYNTIFSLRIVCVFITSGREVGRLTLVIDPDDSASADIDETAYSDWEVHIESAEFF